MLALLFYLFSSILQGQKPTFIETFLPKMPIECLLNDLVKEIKEISVGFTGLIISNSTPLKNTHWSNRFDVRPGPLSTLILSGKLLS